ncbi:hypothetical protein [Euzebya tangerina]|uniref:hypothetical protein n=1 Tax=Euzebya tangerina TaxID=591198 RepID=UPI000E31013A|nr:hypothetical protein [Euzebya tangerina]
MEGAEDQDRRRWSAASWVIVAALVLVVGWVAAGSNGGDFGPPVPTEPPAGAPQTVELTVTARLDGPLADDLVVEGSGFDGWPLRARVGDALLRPQTLLLRARSDRPVDLPDGVLPPPESVLDGLGAWTIDDATGFGVALGAAQPRMVMAADDPDLVDVELPAGRVHPAVPTVVTMWLGHPEITGPDDSWRLDVPFGDSTLVVDVEITPSAANLASLPFRPLEDVAGEVLPVPDIGSARPALIGNGRPVWIANTEEHGITVVDARSPSSPTGVVDLVRWCPGTEGFIAAEYSQYDATGEILNPVEGPGLATYTGAVSDIGEFALDGGRAGSLREALRIVEAHGGYTFDDGGLSSGPWLACTPPDGPHGDPADDDSVPFDISLFPEAPLSIVPSIGTSTVVRADVHLEPDGTGYLCATDSDGVWACRGEDVVAVDVSHRTPDWSFDRGRRAVEGPVVIGAMVDGVVSELWRTLPVEPVPDPSDAPISTVAVWQAFRPVEDLPNDCSQWVEDCLGMASVIGLNILTADGPLDGQDWDGSLPDGWVGTLAAGTSGPREWEQPVVDDANIDGLTEGDLVALRMIGPYGGVRVEPLPGGAG